MILTPNREIQGWIWAIENRYWEPMKETPFICSLKRAMDRGSLVGEMEKLEKQILLAFLKAGLIDCVQYRSTGKTVKTVAEVPVGREVLKRFAPERLLAA